MTSRLLLWSITASLAGFLFGFDTIVISGAEEDFQRLWQLDGFWHGLCMSAALWGTVVGSIFGGMPAARFGRRKCLIVVGVLYFVSAIASAIAPEPWTFMIARFIGGLGVGAATIAAPMFISEISPANNRGKLAGMFQFNIVFGILVAFASNWVIGNAISETIAWRVMLGLEAVPALVYTILSFTLPESPRWLITHANRRDDGKTVFRQINPDMTDADLEKLVGEVEASVADKQNTAHFWTRRLQVPIMLAFLIAFFNQFSGINIILYFAPRLLGLAGLSDPLMASISLGITNLIFTFAGLALIDRIGRRTLLYIGSVGYIASLGICAWAFLSTPAFEVVSAAGDLAGAADTVIAVEAGEQFVTEKDRPGVYAGYDTAKTALVEASSLRGYEGESVAIPADASFEETRDLAIEVTAAAKEFLGFKSMIVLCCLIGFIAAHAIGQGTVIWVFIGEIFPNDHRAAGQSLGSATHWVCAAGLSFLFPIAMEHFEPGQLFGFFTFMMVLQLAWVKFLVPETKGVPLEEMQARLGIKEEK
ncbi:sugar porter family MFS transporter [Stieleria sp. ICT_E10.1]|uniref:sugar porter family MFS transporter n=1 Tax=Stieleria sedimenti TaxID=2976331 RepID=UPI002180312C|nr:sugar porter family MFS transporter [Stieleria sedimenti]MCS7470004.1 sugar porter family MFS transporter [Stieleria sedimenti]